MKSRRRLRAAFFVTAVCAAALPRTIEAAAKTVEVPAARQLGASEPMAAPNQNGTDYSANAPSLGGLTLLATIPASAGPRSGYFVQAQCTAGLSVLLDDQAGSLAPTIVVLAGPSSNGGQGGSLSMAGMPHTGRIRIYSSASGCQMAARTW